MQLANGHKSWNGEDVERKVKEMNKWMSRPLAVTGKWYLEAEWEMKIKFSGQSYEQFIILATDKMYTW